MGTGGAKREQGTNICTSELSLSTKKTFRSISISPLNEFFSQYVVGSDALSPHSHHLPASRAQGLRPQENRAHSVPSRRWSAATSLCLLGQQDKTTKTAEKNRGKKRWGTLCWCSILRASVVYTDTGGAVKGAGGSPRAYEL